MELNSLIFLLMLVYCSNFSASKEIITESSRLWPNPFDRLFNATNKFRNKPESQEKQDLEFYHPDDLKLLNSVKSQKIIPQQQLASNDQQPYPITKLVEELFPERNAFKNKRKPSKPFWGLPVASTTSPRPRFYTRPANTRTNPFKPSQNVDIEDSIEHSEHTTSGYDFLAMANPPTTKNSEAPVIKINPSHPFWGPPFSTSSTWPPPNTKTASSAVFTVETEEDFPFHLSNIAVNNDISENNTSFSPNDVEHKQSYDPSNNNERTIPEHFREPVHLKPGPPYHEASKQQQQQEHNLLDQNVWHAPMKTVTEPTFIPISPESDYPQQQLLEQGIVSNQEQHYPVYPGITPILDVSLLKSKESDSAALATYPKTYPHSAKPETHIIYHQPPATHNNYYHPPSGLTHIDFSPIFLAIVPIALFLGAAAAFALASAVTSNTAVATAQQQQQQQEDSNNNNNNDNNSNNNNINTILTLLAAFNEVKKHHDDNHKIIIVSDEPDLDKVAATEASDVVTIDPPPSPSPSTGPFFIKVSSSTTTIAPKSTTPTSQPPEDYDRKKIMYYHHMNGVT
uniref:Uncharacterized protein n=1 Tax=Daphnia galeata TaxID=27404 RepID=A0A8J2RLE4_9CRUS|nr:unnamed protein product [Daphnia galeata]